MPTLPHADQAIIAAEKIKGYLLARDHPVGGPKATFFEQFGFSGAEPEILAGAILEHARGHDATPVPFPPFGTKYEVIGSLRCPDGRLPIVKTVWIVVVGAAEPRFVTAMPA